MAANKPQKELYDRIEERPLSALLPQANNLNKHTQRGMGMLERSIDEVGWIGAGTMAANGEIFDGSARHEKGDSLDANAIIVKTDGTQPVYVMRTDIPTADHERAVKAGLLANRVAEVNLDWDVPLLVESNEQGLLDVDDYWFPEEQVELLQPDQEVANGGDEGVDQADNPSQEHSKIPLAITLTPDQMFGWNQDKEKLGFATDSKAFMEMWKQWRESH